MYILRVVHNRMRSRLAIVFLAIFPGLVFAQRNAPFKPIDQVGWNIPPISEPETLRESDLGEINFLVTLNKKGKVQSLKTLSSTFTLDAERKWRDKLMMLVFTKQNVETKYVEHKGTLQIVRDYCSNVSVPPLEQNNR